VEELKLLEEKKGFLTTETATRIDDTISSSGLGMKGIQTAILLTKRLVLSS